MPSKIREAALRYDLGATLWRNAMRQEWAKSTGIAYDNDELNGLNVEQLIMLEAKYPEECAQSIEIRRIITLRQTQKEHDGK